MSDDADTLDEIAKDIEKLLNGGVEVTDEERRRHFRHDAAKTCSHCVDCERPLAPGELIWRQRITLGSGMFGRGTQHRLLPICETCSHAKESWGSYRYPHPTAEFRPAQPCQGCGRPVHERHSPRYGFHRNRHVICCENCYRGAELKCARESRTLARGTLECEDCGKSFEADRNDAKFCSSACKQKAYRKRQRTSRSAL